MTRVVRQAVVVVHGMGEQLPLDTLAKFTDAALPRGPKESRQFYSRPESVTGSMESRRFLAPRVEKGVDEVHAQTEFYEYHWSHHMQGNRLDDLWPTFRRILLRPPWRVPAGLKGIWLLAWLLIGFVAWAVTWGPLADFWRSDEDLLTAAISALISGGLVAAVLSYVFSRALPRWLTGSFVDVVRYLDTSPRSYAVRRDIRQGLVEMLQSLQSSKRPHYDRVVIVAHSLGGFIAYDAIAYLWGLTNAVTTRLGDLDLAGLEELEEAASALPVDFDADVDESALARFQEAQFQLWRGQRATGNPWLITDFITLGTPMYFADQLMRGRRARRFADRVERRELPTCPPHNEEDPSNNVHGQPCFYSWRKKYGRHAQVLYEGAPFAVVRWTNLFFPAKFGFFGDWFGGHLAPLFGPGIRDKEITGNTPKRFLPAIAHSFYFSFPQDTEETSVTTALREALGLNSSTSIYPDRPAASPAPKG